MLISQSHIKGGFSCYRELAHCGAVNLENGALVGHEIYDSEGNQFLIKSAQKGRLYNPLNPFNVFKKYREIIAELEIQEIGKVSFEELKNVLANVLKTKKLDGAPFENKEKGIAKYVNKFENMQQMVSGFGYFSYK